MEYVNKQTSTDEILFLLLHLDMVPRNSAPEGFSYIWQSKWVGIISIKTERTPIHFLSDVLIAVASLDLTVPIRELKQGRRRQQRERKKTIGLSRLY